MRVLGTGHRSSVRVLGTSVPPGRPPDEVMNGSPVRDLSRQLDSYRAPCAPVPNQVTSNDARSESDLSDGIRDDSVIEGPRYLLPDPVPGRFRLEDSIALQLDGLVWKCLGIRLERDVMSPSLLCSNCPLFGPPPPFIPLTSVDGLYLTEFADLPKVVACVASHRARGVFIVPKKWDDVGPSIGPLTSRGKSKKRPPTPWMKFLLQQTALTIDLPGDALVTASGSPLTFRYGLWP